MSRDVFIKYTATEAFRASEYQPGAILTLYAVSFSVSNYESEVRFVSADEQEAIACSGQPLGWYGSCGRVISRTYVLAADGRWGEWHPCYQAPESMRETREQALAKLTKAERAALGLG